MATSATLTLRIDPELKEQLDHLALSTNRSKSFLAAEAIRHFIHTNAWHVEAIEKATQQADNGGPFVPHDQVAAWVDSWGNDKEISRPKATRM